MTQIQNPGVMSLPIHRMIPPSIPIPGMIPPPIHVMVPPSMPGMMPPPIHGMIPPSIPGIMPGMMPPPIHEVMQPPIPMHGMIPPPNAVHGQFPVIGPVAHMTKPVSIKDQSSESNVKQIEGLIKRFIKNLIKYPINSQFLTLFNDFYRREHYDQLHSVITKFEQNLEFLLKSYPTVEIAQKCFHSEISSSEFGFKLRQIQQKISV